MRIWMASIVVHAGMPKAGSSAIQWWLESLGESPIDGVVPVVARVRGGRVTVEPHADGPCNSGNVVAAMKSKGEDRRQLVGELMQGLTVLASGYQQVVLSGEALAQPFWQQDQAFLSSLDELGQDHDVVVVYYVRPQHTALEAAWRQWGFRKGVRPQHYLRHRAEQMDYLGTLEGVRSLTSNITFEMRPFRQDLLVGGDVVVDFARVIDVPVPTVMGPDVNRGLALDVVNLLSAAPDGLLGTSPHDNRRFSRLKQLFAPLDIPTSAAAEEGRRILQRWAYETFEPSNMQVVRQLGWQTEFFIEALEEGETDLSRLDTCWRPSASEPELMAFFRLIEELVDEAGARSDEALEPARREAQAALERRLESLERRRSVRAVLWMADRVGGLRRR